MRNLLAQETKRHIRKEYKLRLVVVAASMFSFALIIGAVALLPSFVLSQARQNAVESERAYLEEVEGEDDVEATRIVRDTKTQLELLERLNGRKKFSDRIQSVLASKGAGIHVKTIEYEAEETTFSITIEGVADAREDLLQFERVLKQSENFSTVMLPLSNLAEDREIAFEIVLEGEQQ